MQLTTSVLLALALSASALSSEVKLSTGTYTGTTLTDYNGLADIDAWMGVEYASQPIGLLRFQKTLPPSKFRGTRDAKEYGKVCMQLLKAPYSTYEMGEDCLTMNFFRPANTTADAKLPVAVYVHAGAFQTGAGRAFDAASFVANSPTPIMAVTFNYRVGVFGFPTSALASKLGLLNLGLRDQYQALKFISANIGKFGGDKDAVTLMGTSAGAHSVGFQYLHLEDNGQKPLFARATIHSGGPTARAYPTYDFANYQDQWSQFASTLGCSSVLASPARLLKCLLAIPATSMNALQSGMYAASQYNITWPWQPVLGGPFIETAASTKWAEGEFNKLPLLTGFCNNEGNYYAPQNISTNDEFVAFFRNLLPGLTEEHLQKVVELYPDPTAGNSSSSTLYAETYGKSAQFSRTAAAYGDYAYICTTQDNAVGATSGGVQDVWKYRFNQNNTFAPYLQIPHSCDFSYQWNDPTVQSKEVGEMYSSYLASFVASGDPNTFKAEGTPEWPRYGSGEGQQLYIKEGETVSQGDSLRREQCEFWRSIPTELNH